MQRILVIGSSGAGKSLFSQRLGEATGLPVIHLDRHFWSSGWVEPDRTEWRNKVVELLTGDRWIVDGNYSNTLELRLEKCDTVVFLDFSRVLCTWRVLKRAWQYRGRSRPDIAEGCHEKIDLSFLNWTWNYPTRSRPGVLRKLSTVSERVRIITLRTDREVEMFLNSLQNKNGN